MYKSLKYVGRTFSKLLKYLILYAQFSISGVFILKCFQKHTIKVLQADSFLSAYYFVIITRLQLFRANIPSRATIGPPAKRQLPDF